MSSLPKHGEAPDTAPPAAALPRFELPELPRKIQLGIADGYCNLRCPMCFLHGSGKNAFPKGLRGIMPLDKVVALLDEVAASRPTISPYRWSEPLLIPRFTEYVAAIKERGMAAMINTNGLQLKPELACFLVDVGFDSVTFSLDAVKRDTYRRIRGVDRLEDARQAVFRLLEARGSRTLPRIGVSMTLGTINADECEQFVSQWLELVDVVRVNREVDEGNRILGGPSLGERFPCSMLFDTLVVDYKGDAVLCCLDARSTTVVGNVFRDGIREVWHGPKLDAARHLHREGRWGELPICAECSQWANYCFRETAEPGIIIRESPIMAFHNRVDRLHTGSASAHTQLGRRVSGE